MVEHVYFRSRLASTLDDVVIATCDEEIRSAAQGFGARCIMTSPEHKRASDRTAEAAEHIAADVVVLIQGDEPMTHPDMIDAAVRGLVEGRAGCVNLAGRITDDREMADLNTVKVVVGLDGNALYFSRHPIGRSTNGDFATASVRRQVCIIPFTREMLKRYAALPATPLEEAESIDMLRLLEHGYDVRMVDVEDRTYPVDTPEDRSRVEALMRSDPLLPKYAAASGRNRA